MQREEDTLLLQMQTLYLDMKQLTDQLLGRTSKQEDVHVYKTHERFVAEEAAGREAEAGREATSGREATARLAGMETKSLATAQNERSHFDKVGVDNNFLRQNERSSKSPGNGRATMATQTGLRSQVNESVHDSTKENDARKPNKSRCMCDDCKDSRRTRLRYIEN